jgi:hypothetical protein
VNTLSLEGEVARQISEEGQMTAQQKQRTDKDQEDANEDEDFPDRFKG